jgi:hypothetical protein
MRPDQLVNRISHGNPKIREADTQFSYVRSPKQASQSRRDAAAGTARSALTGARRLLRLGRLSASLAWPRPRIRDGTDRGRKHWKATR